MNGKASIRTLPTLPSHYYFDQTHFHREMEVFWYGRWICVGRFDDLTKPGDYRVIQIGTQSIFVVRDNAGEIKAFYNTCRHRGSLLCEAASGNFDSGRIVCPYHAWTYSLDGKLQKTPWRLDADDFDFDDFSLYRVGAVEWAGYVFVNLDVKDDATLAQALPNMPARFLNWRLETTKIAHRMEVELECNWKIFWENFDECYHCPGVHPELCRVVPTYAKGYSSPSENPAYEPPESSGTEYVEPRLAPGAVTWTLDGHTDLPYFEHLDEAERTRGHTFEMSVPSCYLVGHVDYARMVHMMPLGPERTRLTVDWMLNEESMQTPGFDLEHVIGLGKLVVSQDGHACELNQRGLRSRRHEAGVLVTQERGIAAFHEWIREGLGETGS